MTDLLPGESLDLPGGYVARSWREDRPYYSERTGDTLSPEFGTFAEARAWLELEHLRGVLDALVAQYGDTPAMCALVRYELDQAVKRARVLREEAGR